jgi:hypothetical protein
MILIKGSKEDFIQEREWFNFENNKGKWELIAKEHDGSQ